MPGISISCTSLFFVSQVFSLDVHSGPQVLVGVDEGMRAEGPSMIEGAQPPETTTAPDVPIAMAEMHEHGNHTQTTLYFSVSGLRAGALACNVDLSDADGWWHNGKKMFLAIMPGLDAGGRWPLGQMRYENGGSPYDWGFSKLCGGAGCWTFTCKPPHAEHGHHIAYAVSDSNLPPTTGWVVREPFAAVSFSGIDAITRASYDSTFTLAQSDYSSVKQIEDCNVQRTDTRNHVHQCTEKDWTLGCTMKKEGLDKSRCRTDPEGDGTNDCTRFRGVPTGNHHTPFGSVGTCRDKNYGCEWAYDCRGGSCQHGSDTYTISGLTGESAKCNGDYVFAADNYFAGMHDGSRVYDMTAGGTEGRIWYEDGGSTENWAFTNLCGEQPCWNLMCKIGGSGWHARATINSASAALPEASWQKRNGFAEGNPVSHRKS